MSLSRQSLVLVLFLNAVVSAALVAAGVLAFAPKSRGRVPADTGALTEAVSRLNDENQALRARIDGLQARVEAQAGQIGRLTRKPPRIASAGEPEPVAAGPASPAAAKAKKNGTKLEDPLAKAFGAMLRMQVQRQRGQFIKDILDPTPESTARQNRQVQQLARRVSNAMHLDARDSAEVERILTRVDQDRRDQFRRLFSGKSQPEDVTFPEVKKVLDDSFAEEDRMVKESFPEDTAAAYSRTSEPYRNFAYGLAKAAFPAPADPTGK